MTLSNNEAEKIYNSIFNKKIPFNIQKNFDIVSKRIEARFPDHEISRYFKIISRVNDLEALELAARTSGKLPIIKLKFKTMFYLAETNPENHSRYINEKDNYFSGISLLILSLIRSSYKLLKGLSIIFFYRI